MPEYDYGFIEGKTLLITPVNSTNLLSTDELKEAFGDINPEVDYVPFFQEKFSSILARVSSFSKISSNPVKQSEKLRAMEFIIPEKDTSYFYLPTTKEKISDTAGNNADFILFISELDVARSWIDVEYGHKPNIRHTVYYLFWDNQQNKVACYGKTSHTDGASEKKKETFRLWIDNLAKSLIENTPFKKRRDQW